MMIISWLQRMHFRACYRTVETPTALRIGNTIHMSQKSYDRIKAEAEIAADGYVHGHGFKVVVDPYIPQHAHEPRFPRLMALWRRIA